MRRMRRSSRSSMSSRNRLHDNAGQGIGGPFLGDVRRVSSNTRTMAVCSTGRQLRPRHLSLRWREAREHPPRWRYRRPSRRACMCTSESDYPCRRKWRLRPLTSHTAARNARGRFRLDADWRCTVLSGAARDSALPPDGASSLTKPSNSEEEGICCIASTSGHGRRVARVGLPAPVPLPRN